MIENLQSSSCKCFQRIFPTDSFLRTKPSPYTNGIRYIAICNSILNDYCVAFNDHIIKAMSLLCYTNSFDFRFQWQSISTNKYFIYYYYYRATEMAFLKRLHKLFHVIHPFDIHWSVQYIYAPSNASTFMKWWEFLWTQYNLYKGKVCVWIEW